MRVSGRTWCAQDTNISFTLSYPQRTKQSFKHHTPHHTKTTNNKNNNGEKKRKRNTYPSRMCVCVWACTNSSIWECVCVCVCMCTRIRKCWALFCCSRKKNTHNAFSLPPWIYPFSLNVSTARKMTEYSPPLLHHSKHKKQTYALYFFQNIHTLNQKKALLLFARAVPDSRFSIESHSLHFDGWLNFVLNKKSVDCARNENWACYI